MKQQAFGDDPLKQNIIDIVSKCVRCRFCFSKCPVYEVSDGWVTQGASGMTQALYYGTKLDKIDQDLRDILIRCTTCRSCEILCEHLMAGVNLVDAIIMGRQLLLEEGIDPAKGQKNALESLQLRGNPYGKQPSKRTSWSKGLEVKEIVGARSGIQTLYYVGCTPSYDDRVQGVSRSVAAILKRAGVDFGILKNEKCSGDPARVMGERDLFEMLADENIKNFKDASIKQIVTTSPHDFHCFKAEYPDDIQTIEILHYSQLLEQIIRENKIAFPADYPKKVTYHDPCYLGKHHQIYEAPRKILESIPGLELVEMERNRENSLCCGGGGGRMWADVEESQHLAEVRVQEALDTGAQVMATACPFCLINFEDAIKVLDKQDAIRVLDIAEIVSEAMCLAP